jgi:hypothetical protein
MPTMQAAACHLVRARPTSHRESLVPRRLRARSRSLISYGPGFDQHGFVIIGHCERQFNKED